MGRPRKTPSLADQIRNLDDEIPALEVAIELQEQRQRQAEERLTDPTNDLVAAVLEMGAEEYVSALQRVRDILAELADPLSRLIAADKVRDAIIGDRFLVPKGAKPPFGGLRATRTLIEGIPASMKPSELAERSLFERAHALSSVTIDEVQGVES